MAQQVGGLALGVGILVSVFNGLERKVIVKARSSLHSTHRFFSSDRILNLQSMSSNHPVDGIFGLLLVAFGIFLARNKFLRLGVSRTLRVDYVAEQVCDLGDWISRRERLLGYTLGIHCE